MLVVVPLSTMAAWQKEFTQWAPQMNTVTYNGNAASREIIRNYEMFSKSGQIIFNVVLTNYEMVVKVIFVVVWNLPPLETIHL